MQSTTTLIEYIWLNGKEPASLRSKTKVVEGRIASLNDIPQWETAGPSIHGQEGGSSEYTLKPVFFVPDPIKGLPHILALCELFDENGNPASNNTRADLRLLDERYKDQEPWFGIEQEYTLMQRGTPLGLVRNGIPFPAGPYYCGVGSARVSGRELAEEHLLACMTAGLKMGGMNAEVMPGQWEFQIGPLSPIQISDQLWMARWLLHRISEKYDYEVSFVPKPVDGEWNGAGAHTNFSTKEMRSVGGIEHIKNAIKSLQEKHLEHLKVYGHENEKRLAKQRNVPVTEFTFGLTERNGSVRIPLGVITAGYGYLEDRRPGANMDPYLVCTILLSTICKG